MSGTVGQEKRNKPEKTTSSPRTRFFLWLWFLLTSLDIVQVELSTELDLLILQA